MISILTDFGLEDTYVAAMKAVIHAITPGERILDLTHNVPPGDIARGAVELWRISAVLPAGTLILGVIDPGVGTDRKAIALRGSGFICIGPDNGLFSYLIDAESVHSAVELSNPRYHLDHSSTTFHGRDIFAPAAAHIANGVPLPELGPALDTLVTLPQPSLQVTEGHSIQGEILYADRFGNLVTSIGVLSRENTSLCFRPWIGATASFKLDDADPRVLLPDGSPAPFVEAFGAVTEGSLIAYIGSSGLLEIAVNSGSASEQTGFRRGQPVELKLKG